jgi:hypothetical protein
MGLGVALLVAPLRRESAAFSAISSFALLVVCIGLVFRWLALTTDTT